MMAPRIPSASDDLDRLFTKYNRAPASASAPPTATPAPSAQVSTTAAPSSDALDDLFSKYAASRTTSATARPATGDIDLRAPSPTFRAEAPPMMPRQMPFQAAEPPTMPRAQRASVAGLNLTPLASSSSAVVPQSQTIGLPRSYEKNGHPVVDTARPDDQGHVPTHRLDQPTNKLPSETWEQYENRVLARTTFSPDTATRTDLSALEPDVQRNAASLLGAAKAAGVNLGVGETRRSQERQEMLFQKGRSAPGPIATWTLTSDHTPGRAIDLTGDADAFSWLQANAPKFGFSTMGAMDPGHIAMPKPSTMASVPPGVLPIRNPLATSDITRVGPDATPSHFEPSDMERVLTAPLSFGISAATHPIETAKQLGMMPVNSAANAVAPLKGSNLISDQGFQGRNIARFGSELHPGEVTPAEKIAGIAQTFANAAAPGLASLVTKGATPAIAAVLPRIAADITPEAAQAVSRVIGGQAGHVAASLPIGAAYDPQHPVAGALGLALTAGLFGLSDGELRDTYARAASAGRDKVAGLIQAARDANANARVQGVQDARTEFNAMVARTVPTLSPSDLAHIQADPILGPLSRPGLEQAGIAPRPTLDVERAHAALQNVPQTEPDVPVGRTTGVQFGPSQRPGDVLRDLVNKYRTAAPTDRFPSTEPPTVTGTVVPLPSISDADRRVAPQTAPPQQSTRIEDAVTGQPFRAELMRGQGREGSPYNELGAQVPLLGQGRYTTPHADFAREFGDNVTTHAVALDNPLVIDSDAQWRDLTARAGWKFPNPFGQDPAKVESDIARLRSMIEVQGHDGVIVRVPSEERTGKTLGKMFGADQVLEFSPRETAPPSTPDATRGRVEAAAKPQESGGLPSFGDQLRDLARQFTPEETPERIATPTRQVGPSIASEPGRSTRVLLRDGQALPAEYRVVDAESLQSSHDPFSFTPNPNYPEGVQGRDYQRNKAAQSAVAQRSLGFNPDIALNPSESVSEGTPTILPDGTVIAGNERSMLPRRAMVHAPERYGAYVEQLRQRAAEFGIDPEAVDRVERPVLVRVLTDPNDVNGGVARWSAINRLSDEVATKAKSATEEGTARAAKLAHATDALDHLSATLQPEQTVAEYLGTGDGREFVRKLMAEQVITPDEFSRLSDGSGTLTEDGRLAVRRMLLSTAVTDPAVVLDAPASIVAKIEQAVPAIVSTKGTKFDTSKLTTAALRMIAEARDNGVTIHDLEGQGGLFGESANRKPTVTALAGFLQDAKPTEVKAAFRRYAALAREALGSAESTDMFGGTGYEKPIDAFNDAFGFSRKGAPIEGKENGELYANAPLKPDARTAELFSEIPPQLRRSAPTRAGELIAEARAPRTSGAGRALGGEEAPPKPEMAVRGTSRFADSLRKIFAPASRGPEARATGLTIREHDAALVQRYEQAKAVLMTFAKAMDALPVREQLDFIDRLETAQAQATPELTHLATSIRGLLDSARDDIRALGDGQLEHWIENYFPHIWADPERARGVIASIMGNRSLTGPGSFLKRRTIPTIRDGIEAGLVPVTFNPIDLTLLKLREMHRYLAGQRILEEMKGDGRLRFVSSFSKSPEGYQQINDKISTVYGPPKVSVVEAYDHAIRQGLEEVMKDLGVTHERRPNIGGSSSGGVRLGFARGDDFIATRSATDLSVLEHELGHVLDARLNLWQRLHDFEAQSGQKPTLKAARAFRVAIDTELRALADLRHEGITNVEPSQHEYVRRKEEKIANAVMGILHAPERMREVAPTVDAKLRALLASDPVTAKILDIKPSFRHAADTFDVKTPGQVVLGHWYAPEPVARVVNNYLSPGVSQSAIGPWFDVYRQAGNLLNMAQLGMSAYHLGFTSLDAAVSRTALGVLQLREGQPIKALGSFATAPIAPVTNAIRGIRLKDAYLHGTTDPVLAQIVDGLVAAGGRVKMDEFYGGGAWRQAKLALHEGKYGRAAAKALPAAIEQSTAWLMQHVVPWQKLGVFYDLAQHELAKLPAGADRQVVRQVMARAWDSVENRMGQMTYNNLFWHRFLKDGLMASVRSVGWNLGTIRELGGGTMDLARSVVPNTEGRRLVLTPRASYVVALPITVALAGGILHVLYTGKVPETLKDWFYPRTGRVNPDGTEERVQLPSYLRDVRDYSTAPWQTIKNKVNPSISLMADMLENRDFFGDQIRNGDDPLIRQIAQEAAYTGEQFTPFGIRNAFASYERGQSGGTIAQNFFGITPAPRDVVRTPALQRLHDLMQRGAPSGATPEQASDRQARAAAIANIRRDGVSGYQAIADAVQHGRMSIAQAQSALRTAQRAATVSQFVQLPLADAVDVYRLGNADERRLWGPALQAKLARARTGGIRPADLARIRAGLAGIQSDTPHTTAPVRP